MQAVVDREKRKEIFATDDTDQHGNGNKKMEKFFAFSIWLSLLSVFIRSEKILSCVIQLSAERATRLAAVEALC